MADSMHRAHADNLMKDIVVKYNVGRTCTIKVVNDTAYQKVILEDAVPYCGEIAENHLESDLYNAILPGNRMVYICKKGSYSLYGCSGTLTFQITGNDGYISEGSAMVVGYYNPTLKFPGAKNSCKACVGLYSNKELAKKNNNGALYASTIGSNAGEKSSRLATKYASDSDKKPGRAKYDKLTASLTITEGDHCNIVVVVKSCSDSEQLQQCNVEVLSASTLLPKVAPKPKIDRSHSAATMHSGAHYASMQYDESLQSTDLKESFAADDHNPQSMASLLNDLGELIRKYSADEPQHRARGPVDELLHDLKSITTKYGHSTSTCTVPIQDVLCDLKKVYEKYMQLQENSI